MSRTVLGGCLVAAALLLLPACAGPSAQTLPEAVAQQRRLPFAERSWMAPEAKGQDLLYVMINGSTGYVNVYSFPAGKYEGQLTGLGEPTASCVDSAGDVFIPDYTRADIVEYAHGNAVPITILDDEQYSYPSDCSVDPVTGNLAVANYSGPLGGGDIVVYPKARPPYHVYTNLAGLGLYGYCSYDDKGNLFFSSANLGFQTEFGEIPRGGAPFKEISQPVQEVSAALQWDGEYLTMNGSNAVYQLVIEGSTARIVGTTSLNGSNFIAGYAIPKLRGSNLQYNRIVVPDYNGADVRVWKYPEGGTSIKTIPRISGPIGVVVSPAAR